MQTTFYNVQQPMQGRTPTFGSNMVQGRAIQQPGSIPRARPSPAPIRRIFIKNNLIALNPKPCSSNGYRAFNMDL